MTSVSGRELKCCSASFGIFCLSFIVFVAGAASPQWYTLDWEDVSEFSVGVFWGCEYFPRDTCDEIELSTTERWWRGSAAMMASTMVLAVVAGFVAMFPPLSAALQIAAGVVGVAGSIVFVVEVDDLYGPAEYTSISWGFYMAVIGSALFLLNGVGLAIACCVSRCTMTLVCCCCGVYKRNRDLP